VRLSAATGRARSVTAADEKPSRDWLKAALAIASAFFVFFVVMVWRMSRKTKMPAFGFTSQWDALETENDSPVTINEKYIRGRKIGEGGMGAVYEGQDNTLRRRVAIKRLRPELQKLERERARFVTEAHNVAKLHHPNIVEIYDVVETAGETYIVFEYVDGRTLHDELNNSSRRRLSPRAALDHLRQIAEALDHAHKRGVIHRDLKPSNMMIDENERVKIMDFGISRVVLDTMATTTNTIVGTPVYMAPEQSMGSVNKKLDVYALGVSFYEMLTGALPFKGDDLNGKMDGRFPKASALLPDLPAAMDVVIARALAPDPDKRYESCTEFYKAALDALRQVTPS
jgi:serine/threonine-protein kinase